MDPLSKPYFASSGGGSGSTAPGTPLMLGLNAMPLPSLPSLGPSAASAAASAGPPPAANISNHNHGSSMGGAGGPTSSPPPAHPHSMHHRSQSTFVPMHSPSPSMQFDALGMGLGLGLGPVAAGPTRAHGSMGHNTGASSGALPSAAGILATTPSAAAIQQQQLQQLSVVSPGSSVTPEAAAAAAATSTPAAYDYPTRSADYDVFAEIGSGAFSSVYRGCVRESGEPVAIKVIDLDLFNTNWDEIRKEIMIQAQLQHPNVVKLKTAFVDGQDLWIVMSLLTAGSCASVMKELGATNGLKDEVMIATILKEVLQALAYFHKHGSIHRDVKAGNILISGSGDVQLADFGVAGTLMEGGDRKKNRQTFTGTPCWMAPEVMEHTESEGYDQAADIWSFGITAMELGYGRAPYAKYPPMKVMLLTLQEEPPTAAIYKDNSYEFSKHYHSMVAKCLRRDPKKRPNVRKLLEHKFFAKAANAAYLYEHLVKRLPVKSLSGEKKMSVRKHGSASASGAAVAGEGAAGGAGAGGAGGAGGGEATLRAPDGAVLHPSSAQLSSALNVGNDGAGNTLGAPHPGAGVKLGSWIFDEEEISSFKSTEGAPALDLLTGTLQHQLPLPHHHHHNAHVNSAAGGAQGLAVMEEDDECDDVDEPEEDNEEEQGTMQRQQQQQQSGLHEQQLGQDAFSQQQQQQPQQSQQNQLQQQQQQQSPLHEFESSSTLAQTSPFGSHQDLLSAAAAFAASSAPSPAAATLSPEMDLLHAQHSPLHSPSQQLQQQSVEEPHDFFADVSAPAEQAALVPLSPSAAFAVAALGAGLPPLAPVSAAARGSIISTGGGVGTLSVGVGVGGVLGAAGVVNTATGVGIATPTLSSVQGRTRQFLVSEEELPGALPASPHLMTDAHVGGHVLAPSPPIDLLSGGDDLALDALAQTQSQAPSASQQYLDSLGGGGSASPRLEDSASAGGGAGVGGGAGGAERATTPLSFDSLSLAPGSATLAYLAAAGGVIEPGDAAPAEPAAPAPISAAPRLDRPLSDARARMAASASSESAAPAAVSVSVSGSSPHLGSTRQANAGSPGSRLSGNGNAGAPGLQLLDMHSSSPPSSGAGSASASAGGSGSGSLMPPGPGSGPRSLSSKRGSGTLASLGLGLLPVQMPVLRQTPSASGAAAASAPVAGSPNSRGMGAPMQLGLGSTSSAMPPSAHSPVLGVSQSIFHSSSSPSSGAAHAHAHAHAAHLDAHPLSLNIPSPPGNISSPQAQLSQPQSAGASGPDSDVRHVGRFQVTSSGVPGDQ